MGEKESFLSQVKTDIVSRMIYKKTQDILSMSELREKTSSVMCSHMHKVCEINLHLEIKCGTKRVQICSDNYSHFSAYVSLFADATVDDSYRFSK